MLEIITGEEVVGWVCYHDEIRSLTFNQLHEREKKDYLSNVYPKFIYVDYHDKWLAFEELPMFYSKKELLENVIATTDEKIRRHNKQIENLHKEIRGMLSLNSGYYQLLEEI